jgi:hypothetical protein
MMAGGRPHPPTASSARQSPHRQSSGCSIAATCTAMRAGLIGGRWSLVDLYSHLRDRWPDFLVTEKEKADVG